MARPNYFSAHALLSPFQNKHNMEHNREHTPTKRNLLSEGGRYFPPMGNADKATLFLRLFIGALLFTQAITKSQQYMWLEQEYPSVLGLSPAEVVSFVGIMEAVAGVMLTTGLLTRVVSVVMVVAMLSAALLFFPSQSFDQAELKVVYAGIYASLAISGGGLYSLDNIIFGLRNRGKD